jgi:hypothetical protein
MTKLHSFAFFEENNGYGKYSTAYPVGKEHSFIFVSIEKGSWLGVEPDYVIIIGFGKIVGREADSD